MAASWARIHKVIPDMVVRLQKRPDKVTGLRQPLTCATVVCGWNASKVAIAQP